MVIVLDKEINQKQYENVLQHIIDYGFDVKELTGKEYIVLGAIGVKPNFDIRKIKVLEGVTDVYRISEPYRLASRKYKKENSIIKIKDVEMGGERLVVMAGPCAVENEKQIFTIAEKISKAGAKILRGGAFKPRSSPYSFQGLGEEGLKLLRKSADEFGLLVVTEVMESNQIDMVGEYADIFQVGSRNMQNFPLLNGLGKVDKPVFLKRGMAATIDDWLMSAEYILSNGNKEVILCERGIRSIEQYTRNTFDVSAIPVIKEKSHLPIIADPSHAVGYRDKIIPVALAAIAAGADGLMVEVHHQPEEALSDGPQALLPEQFEEMMKKVLRVGEVVGKRI